ncbi:hypothetical protein BJ993_004300 [Nocardioides aromaticivorans]|uniref:Uncharacterized protein n=1 Tax=Nocardioides aromaticivorans TaxID=200618 RepID=A0A7Z0CQQ4_9ACTN|nr:hypothetical protein [Nocardioides aromaticivorans]NYI47220.1 hypothetical protein [Nocardioides aromaticivorans]
MGREPADDERISERAELLPEEVEAGSEDPRAQAEAILDDSDERVDDPEGTRRESSQTPGPD